MTRPSPCSAKPGCAWSQSELDYFNIQVQTVDALTFFGVPELPEPPVSDAILKHLAKPPDGCTADEMHFFEYMSGALSGGRSEVTDFAAFLLRYIGYEKPGRTVHQYEHLPFRMCGIDVEAKISVCVESYSFQHILVLQVEDLKLEEKESPDPVAQLAAQAIAAFTKNKRVRHDAGLPPVPFTVIPGIIISRATATFYRIPVSDDLVQTIVTVPERTLEDPWGAGP
ncbi:hypothetical protein AX16_010245 [Volvariella volvacea WC 439]|nr:hypothetical protein AX16_010245 [Volvariella volvacea WC 439]